MSREVFDNPRPRQGIIEKLERDLGRMGKEHQENPVLLCFTCDPYQPIDQEFHITTQAIKSLHSHDMKVMILTKGGHRAEHDFDLLTNDDWFGVTLTNLDDTLSQEWEPGAALPAARIESLRHAHENGIKTWVSLEPVLYPETTLEIIRQTHGFVDEFKVGMLNHHPHAKNTDWHEFAVRVKRLLKELGSKYYLKEDLREWL